MINSILDAYLKANPHKRPTLTPIVNQTKVNVQKKSRSNTRSGRRAAKNMFQAQNTVIQSHRVAYNDEVVFMKFSIYSMKKKTMYSFLD